MCCVSSQLANNVPRTWTQYRSLFEALDRTDARAVVISGSGKHFCSGLDVTANVAQIAAMDEQTAPAFIKTFQDAVLAPIRSHVPVISISHGVSFGLALDVISATTIRLCTRDTRFSVKEIDIGIMADVGSLQRLGYLVSNQSTLNEWALTAREFSGTEANELGLVSGVFATKEDAMKYALHIATLISSKYRPAIAGTKKHLELMNVNSEWAHRGLQSVARDNGELMASVAYKEFFAGFLAKMKARL